MQVSSLKKSKNVILLIQLRGDFMPSRMEKYYNNSNQDYQSRANRNSDLYKNLYDGKEYTNVEGIATIEKTNEVDLDKIRQLLKEHEELKQEKKPVISRPVKKVEEEEVADLEEKNYDIMDVLSKAKSEYSDDNKNRSLRNSNTQYNILKNINIKEGSDDTSLKELINTITSTSVLNKLGDRDLSLGILNELKSDDNTMIGAKGSNELLKINNEKVVNDNTDDEENLDKSFYTSSLNFNEKDFEQLNDIKSSLKKNNILITVLVFFFLTVIVAGILFVLYSLK